MATYGLTDKQNYENIADAIRTRSGNTVTYKPSEMAPAILALPSASAMDPLAFDMDTGYVQNGVWNIGGSTVSYSDVYQVRAGCKYLITLGSVVGTRFRAMISSQSTIGATSNITGTSIINQNNPAAYTSLVYTPSIDGFITIQKDNAGHANLRSYVYDVNDLVDHS